jgi:7-carboxy-7-deazaguanine synthase (Cx14CxxC type)
MYSIKEIFYTLQGEGAQSGRASVFCRFTGCNLWSGREEDRSKAICQFCDTDFLGTDGINGGVFGSPRDLAIAIKGQWRGAADSVATPFVVFTGGEPLLQIDGPLIDAMHDVGFEVAVETNGTIPAPSGIDWVCVSPKAGAALRQIEGHELKVVIPQGGLDLAALEGMSFQHFYVQPMDGSDYEENCRRAVKFCLDRPKWRISTQVHKHLAIA